MEGELQTSAMTVLTSIAKVFAIIALGFLLKRRKILSDTTVTELTRLVINIVVPCFLFSRMYREFSLEKITQTYQMALFTVIITLLAVVLAFIASKWLKVERIRRHSMIALCTFNNSGYLPIPLAYALLDKTQADQVIFYIAIYIFVVSPLMWSWGIWLLSRKSEGISHSITKLLSPPALGILLGIVLSLSPFSGVMKRLDFVVGAATILGDATIPLAMIIIGTLLASIKISKSIEPRNLAAVVVIKLLIIPAAVLFFLKITNVPCIMGFAMLLEAAMPPAANLAIIAKHYDGDIAFVSTAQLVTYIVTIFTLPIFMRLLIC